MSSITKPDRLPLNACFSSGPCAKRPGWSFDNLDTQNLGRSHRSVGAKKQLKALIDLTRDLLEIPDNYRIGITPASDTGAMELAMWNLLGAPGVGVDVFAWEQFSWLWLKDIMDELRLPGARAIEAPYGELADLHLMQPDRDAVFAWNGTTGGTRVPDGEDAFPAGDAGLRICDATSGVFAYDMPWHKLDVVTWSWQKSMGSEAQHGMIVMSPKAIKRLQDYTPPWPMPKIFQLRNGNDIDWPFFDGVTLNTPSMMCVSDAMDSLQWMKSLGGLPAIHARIDRNAAAVDAWVDDNATWIAYLAADPVSRSKTSICLRFCAEQFTTLDKNRQTKIVDRMIVLLEQENAAYDIRSYKTAPLGLRIWCGSTVETANVEAMLPWIGWAYRTALAE